jgi:hypothetical protein
LSVPTISFINVKLQRCYASFDLFCLDWGEAVTLRTHASLMLLFGNEGKLGPAPRFFPWRFALWKMLHDVALERLE